jgi:uncharacterized membrane protein YoaK (UPF0700 family)
MLVLTFSTGVVDAVGYLGLDRVFTANMTGNVVILGMALTGAESLPVAGPAAALVAFFVGALVGGRVLRGAPAGWSVRATAALLALAIVIAGAAVAALVCATSPALELGVTIAVSFSMGAQAGVARHLGVADVTTVVVTSTLVGLAYDSRLGRGSSQKWVRRLLAVVAIGAGAVVGALLVRLGLAPGMLLCAAIVAAVAVAGHLGRAAGVGSAEAAT